MRPEYVRYGNAVTYTPPEGRVRVTYFAPFRKQSLGFVPTDTEANCGCRGCNLSDPDWRWRLAQLRDIDALAIEGHGQNGTLRLYSKTATQVGIDLEVIDPWDLWNLIRNAFSPYCKTIVIHACESLSFGRVFKWTMNQTGREVWAFEGTLHDERWDSVGDQAKFTKL